MYPATKSFERFRQPKSVVDEKKSVDNAVPKSTAYKTKWSCKVFEEWQQNRLVKSCTLEPGGLFTTKDFEEGVQTLDTAITEMSACSLNYWLHILVVYTTFTAEWYIVFHWVSKHMHVMWYTCNDL